MIQQLLGCADKDSLCFTPEELQKVLDDRAAEKKAPLEKSLNSTNKIPKTSEKSDDKSLQMDLRNRIPIQQTEIPQTLQARREHNTGIHTGCFSG